MTFSLHLNVCFIIHIQINAEKSEHSIKVQVVSSLIYRLIGGGVVLVLFLTFLSIWKWQLTWDYSDFFHTRLAF